MALSSFGQFFRAPTQPERYAALHVRADVADAATTMATDRRSDLTVQQIGQVLPEAEIVTAMVEGRFRKFRGLVVLTTLRVLFVGHGYQGGPLLEIALDDLPPAGARAAGTRIHLQAAEGPVVIDQTLGTSASIFVTALVRQLSTPQQPVRRDPLELLAEIRLLHRSGVMTDSEYAAEKARLMDRI